MDNFVSMPASEQRLYYEQAQSKLGLPPATIEKDYWVCWTLRELFSLPKLGDQLTFKGGTSLSKAWNLIHRFSEDVDIVINREGLGFVGGKSPENAPSKKQTQKRLKALREASQLLVNTELLPNLDAVLKRRIERKSSWRLVSDPDDPDGQTLLFSYPTVFSSSMAYLRQEVKMEFGARSDTEPTVEARIQPYLDEAFQDLLTNAASTVRIVSPERTFWEKAMLLHEETFRPASKKRKPRMARHYYDLHCLIQAGIGDKAARDLALFSRIAEHRQIYFRYTWVDYSTLRPNSLRLVPPTDQLSSWRADYNAMKAEMFFREPPNFEETLSTVTNFQEKFLSSDSSAILWK